MHTRPRLVLLEDNRLLRWWMTSTLEREGFDVTPLDSLEAMRRIGGAASFEVLVTDWRLADGPNGLEVLALARRRNPGIVAVLISAEANAELAARARAAGFDMVLEKPVLSAEIIEAISRVAARDAAGVAG